MGADLEEVIGGIEKGVYLNDPRVVLPKEILTEIYSLIEQ